MSLVAVGAGTPVTMHAQRQEAGQRGSLQHQPHTCQTETAQHKLHLVCCRGKPSLGQQQAQRAAAAQAGLPHHMQQGAPQGPREQHDRDRDRDREGEPEGSSRPPSSGLSRGMHRCVPSLPPPPSSPAGTAVLSPGAEGYQHRGTSAAGLQMGHECAVWQAHHLASSPDQAPLHSSCPSTSFCSDSQVTGMLVLAGMTGDTPPRVLRADLSCTAHALLGMGSQRPPRLRCQGPARVREDACPPETARAACTSAIDRTWTIAARRDRLVRGGLLAPRGAPFSPRLRSVICSESSRRRAGPDQRPRPA